MSHRRLLFYCPYLFPRFFCAVVFVFSIAHEFLEKSVVVSSLAFTSAQTRELFPVTTPFKTGSVQEHNLYYEMYGNEKGVSALFLHGGPGAGCFPRHACFFNPEFYCIVLLDQRGCGRSKPLLLTENETKRLVEDCEVLRSELGFDKWGVVMGGSWGSFLAIRYAQEFPSKVRSIILRGVCLMRAPEVEWLFGEDGVAILQVEAWNEFAQMVLDSDSRRHNRSVLYEYCNWLIHGSPEHRIAAAQKWFRWEMTIGKYNGLKEGESTDDAVFIWNKNKWSIRNYSNSTDNDLLAKVGSYIQPKLKDSNLARNVPEYVPAYPRKDAPSINMQALSARNMTKEDYLSYVPAQNILTCWYSVKNGFDSDIILSEEKMRRIRHIPCIAIHGGRDFITPIDNALDLADAWPGLELNIPLASKHSMYEPRTTSELIIATEKLKDYLT